MELYEKELSNFETRMQACKPKRENFETEWEFRDAYGPWEMEYFCDRPNKPGYHHANND